MSKFSCNPVIQFLNQMVLISEPPTFNNILIFLNGPTRPLFLLFSVFSNKHYNFYNNNVKKCLSIMWCWDSTHDLLKANLLLWPLDQGSHTCGWSTYWIFSRLILSTKINKKTGRDWPIKSNNPISRIRLFQFNIVKIKNKRNLIS